MLHRLALGSPGVLRAMLHLETGRWKDKAPKPSSLSPVFICGLARSGSTLLLNRLVGTGAFSTSTYRHMPFVLAPNSWGGASKKHQKEAAPSERAHGDGMSHSFDSEEAFEEVFWRAMEGNRKAPMLPWQAKITASTMAQFRLFMASVVKAGSGPRYLSKNNNNVVRVPGLLKAARTAKVLIPFRHPVHFAGSTLSQHQKFLDRAKASAFDATYMAWLGHHEFGPLFKPFAAPGVAQPDVVDMAYLVEYWIAVYRALLEIDDPRVLYFDYDGFCAAPEKTMAALGRVLDLDAAPIPPKEVHPPHEYALGNVPQGRLAVALALHKELRNRALGAD